MGLSQGHCRQVVAPLGQARRSGVVCETAAWAAGGRRLPMKPYITWEHRLRRHDYDQAHDSFDYR